jgi:hypothetical protein
MDRNVDCDGASDAAGVDRSASAASFESSS